ncbi:MAG: hypothetical protein ACYCPT_14090, partial [Acidimicrobiales bacterium]
MKQRPAKRVSRERREAPYIGIDGEGIGRRPQRYVMLCAASDTDKRWEETDMRGLSTIACLDFILGLPRSAKVFGFAFSYDLTKILTDVPDGAIYRLLRPELRAPRARSKLRSPTPVVLWLCTCASLVWNEERCPHCKTARTNDEYRLNYQAGKFTVAHGMRRTVVWDVFRFYGCKFTRAIKDWRVLEDSEIAAIETMKGLRGSFTANQAAAMTDYCFSECRALA